MHHASPRTLSLRRSACLWLACALLWSTAPAHADEAKIESFTLPNGMEVIVLPNARVPAVNHTLWFRVGAADDPPGKSGLAHYHEHMMFQGTKTRRAGEYSQIIARNGGRENAFTTPDAVGYWASVPKEQLATVMELEADRLQNLSPSEKDALKEREVIIEERRSRTENSPAGLFSEQMEAALYLNHPYHIPIIGWMHEMEKLTLADVMDFHRRYTQPGNAILILSGDITAKEARPLVEKYYGPLASGEKLNRQWRDEPPHRAARHLVMYHDDVNEPSFSKSYLAPSLAWGKTQHAVPMMILGYVLGSSNTSRLYQSLVAQQKIATSAYAGYNAFSVGPSSLDIKVTPAPGQKREAIEAAVMAEIARLQKEGITAEELERAKTLLKADAIYSREGLQQMGQIMGWIRITGLPVETFQRWPQMIEAVTAQQVKDAAAEVVKEESSVSGWLLPAKEKP